MILLISNIANVGASSCSNCDDNIQILKNNQVHAIKDLSGDVEISSDTIRLSANSEIPLPPIVAWIIEVIYFDIPLIGQWDPVSTYWELYNPVNERAYKVEADVIYTKHLGHFPPIGFIPGYDKWEIHIKNPRIKIPAFPQTGTWQLKIVICDELGGLGWDIQCGAFVSYLNVVGESSITDNLMAPIYITYGGLPGVGWGAFSFALPSLFILSSPIWFIGLLFVALIIWKQSFKLAKKEFMNGLSEIKKRVTFRKKGGKKDVKKIKAKKVTG